MTGVTTVSAHLAPKKWDKLNETARVAMRLSDAGLAEMNRRYLMVNLHDYIAQLFLSSRIDGNLDLVYNRRKLELGLERLCSAYKWANKAKALRLLNEAWEHVQDTRENPRMFLRQYQDEPGPRALIDEYVAKEWK